MPSSAARLAGLFLLACAPAAPAQFAADRPDAPAAGLLRDTWEAAYLDGVKAGYVHFTVQEVGRGPNKLLRATQELHLTVKRFGQLAVVHAEVGTDETADGQVVGVFMRQGPASQQTLAMAGTVADGVLTVKVTGQFTAERQVRWSEGVLSLRAEQDYLKTHRPKPGDTFTYQLFEPTVNAVVTVHGTVHPAEAVPALGGRKFLRVELRPEKIQQVQLPTAVHWVDPQTYARARTQTELPGLGVLATQPATRAVAVAPVAAPEQLGDLNLRQSIRLNRRLAPDQLAAVTYRVRLPGDDDPGTAFARDTRQALSNLDPQARSFLLTVREQRRPGPAPAAAVEPGDEFLRGNHYIASDDPEVRRLAKQAVGAETDPWQKALKVERWVRGNMRAVSFDEALAPADRVARTLSGDCTEYAMLAAALCRAAGVPSRTALGLVYFERNDQGLLAYHMWTEVFVRGQWLAIDATLGQGGVGPGHLKIADHSWHDTYSFAPLLPVTRVLMGRAEVTVVEAERRRGP